MRKRKEIVDKYFRVCYHRRKSTTRQRQQNKIIIAENKRKLAKDHWNNKSESASDWLSEINENYSYQKSLSNWLSEDEREAVEWTLIGIFLTVATVSCLGGSNRIRSLFWKVSEVLIKIKYIYIVIFEQLMWLQVKVLLTHVESCCEFKQLNSTEDCDSSNGTDKRSHKVLKRAKQKTKIHDHVKLVLLILISCARLGFFFGSASFFSVSVSLFVSRVKKNKITEIPMQDI